MSLRARIARRIRLAALARLPAPAVSRWTFVVGWENGAVTTVARQLAHPGSAWVDGPDSNDVLARPQTFRVPHTWGTLPVHFALEAHEPGVDHARCRRQWAHAASGAEHAIVVGGVNALRLPWLQRHWPGCRIVVADLDPVESVAWIRAHSGASVVHCATHVHRVRTVLSRSTGPVERVQVTLPDAPLLAGEALRQAESVLTG